ncbi:MAG: hypothetical protein FJX56_08635 [Alphaproteobacteria bacterium]|nr:hypothetical protein [Alphaproteobacteria bacterium]
MYTEQVRTYDIVADPASGTAVVEARVFGGPIIGSRLALSDPLAAWRGRSSRRAIGADAVAELRRALRAGEFYGPAPVGLRLDSGSFYWVVNACEDGQFRFNAYAAPTARFAALRFLDVLLPLDDTGLPANPERARGESGLDRPGRPVTSAAASGGPRFTLEVGRTGIIDGVLF